MKRKREDNLFLECDHYCCCLLDLNYSSNLLSSKIADIPHKLKYETILAPIFEYCFGTSDQDLVWEELTEEENREFKTTKDELIDYPSRLRIFHIDWIKDGTFIYSQIFNLVEKKLNVLAIKLGLWKNRQFIIQGIRNCYRTKLFIRNVNYFNTDNSEFIKYDRELVMEAVKQDGAILECTSDQLKADREIVIQAVSSGYGFQYASKELQDDKEVLMIALETSKYAYDYASERLKNDREVMFKAVSNGLSICSLGEKHRYDREILLMTAKNDYFLSLVPDEFKNDKELVMEAIQHDNYAFKYASDELKNDREFVKEIVTINENCLKFASKELNDDKEIVELALKLDPDVYFSISHRLRDDTEFISKLIGKRGFFSIPYDFECDREIVLESIKICSRNMEEVPDAWKNDREFILEAVKNNGIALQYVYEEFKYDREIVMEAIQKSGNAIAYVPAEIIDEEIILKAVETATYVPKVKTLTDFFVSERELMMKCGILYDSFPRRYRQDKEIVLESVKTAIFTFELMESAFPLIARERTLAMRIVKREGIYLRWLPSKYRNDRELVSFAIKENKKAFQYASDELKNDLEILKLYCSNT